MKKRICAVVCAVTMLLSGCGGIQITERENDVMAEYAATLLLKYSTTYQSKLQDTVKETETTVSRPNTTNNNSSTNAFSSQIGQSAQNNQLNETTVSQKNLAQSLGIADGFQVEYQGYEITNAYPKSTDTYFSMQATKGKMLLVLKFNIINTSGEEKECDVLSSQPSFRCTVNSENRFNSQLTMLLDDLSSYKETITAGETKQAILIFQIPEKYENSVEQIELTVKNGSESNNFSLQ